MENPTDGPFPWEREAAEKDRAGRQWELLREKSLGPDEGRHARGTSMCKGTGAEGAQRGRGAAVCLEPRECGESCRHGGDRAPRTLGALGVSSPVRSHWRL